jgi:hypothetical protein
MGFVVAILLLEFSANAATRVPVVVTLAVPWAALPDTTIVTANRLANRVSAI